MARSTKHYHAMNGDHGCMPDNNEVFHSKASAIDYLVSSFDFTCIVGMKSNLRYGGIHHFNSSIGAGADYCQVSLCHDADCLIDHN